MESKFYPSRSNNPTKSVPSTVLFKHATKFLSLLHLFHGDPLDISHKN